MMGKYYYAAPQFPFAKVFPLGIVLVILGVISLVLGITDIIYTYLKYTGTGCDNTFYASWQCSEKPCNSNSIPWAMASPGIWCGIFVLIGGAISTSLMYASSSTIKGKRDAAGVLVGLVGFPIGPMALVVCALRLYNMNGSFFCLISGVVKVTDYLQFIMPILQAVVLFLAWCLAVAVLVALCRKGALTQRDQLEYDHSRRYRDDYKNPRMSTLQRPFIYASTESVPPQPTVWRDRSAGYQNPYMYARSEQPQYVYAMANTDRNYPYLSYPGRPSGGRRWYTVENTYNRY